MLGRQDRSRRSYCCAGGQRRRGNTWLLGRSRVEPGGLNAAHHQPEQGSALLERDHLVRADLTLACPLRQACDRASQGVYLSDHDTEISSAALFWFAMAKFR